MSTITLKRKYLIEARAYLEKALKSCPDLFVHSEALLSPLKNGTYCEYVTVRYYDVIGLHVGIYPIAFCTAAPLGLSRIYYFYSYNICVEKFSLPLEGRSPLDIPLYELRKYVQMLSLGI